MFLASAGISGFCSGSTAGNGFAASWLPWLCGAGCPHPAAIMPNEQSRINEKIILDMATV